MSVTVYDVEGLLRLDWDGAPRPVMATPELLADIVAQLNELRSIKTAIRGLHTSDGTESPFCNECGHSWPCATIVTSRRSTVRSDNAVENS